MTSISHGPPNAGARMSMFHPAFLLLNLSYLLVFSNVALFYLYPVALDEMGAGTRTIGWVMGAFSLAAVVSRPLMGAIAARRGEFSLMSIAMAVMLGASACYPLLGEAGVSMLTVRVLHGIGFSAYVAGSFSAVASLFPGDRRAQAYSLVGASLMAAVALAPLAGETLVHRFGFGALYLCACLLIAAAWAAVAGAAARVRLKRPRQAGDRTRYGRLLGNGSFLFLLLSTLIFAHCQATLFNFLALAGERRGASAGAFLFVAFALAIGILLTMGRVIDRGGKRRFLGFAYPGLSLGLILLPLFFGRGGGWLPAVLFGAGMGFLFPAHNALAAGHGGEGDKPAVMALFTAVYDTGYITGAVLSGWIAARLGLDGLFYATGALAAVGFLICVAAPIREGE